MTAEEREIRVPDIGDFRDVEIIEVLVGPGARIEPETPLITLESDKASMDIPSPAAGVVSRVLVKTGDKVSEGTPILTVRAEPTAAEQPAEPPPDPAVAAAEPAGASRSTGGGQHDFEVLVLGAGPGGYTAAFRAADLGKKTVLVERYPQLGGVCLNVGCIPSKALLHVARVLTEVEELEAAGIKFGQRGIEPAKIRAWTEKIVGKLTGGLRQLAGKRGVELAQGVGRFADPHTLALLREDGTQETFSFAHAVIAAGSRTVPLPGLPDALAQHPRLLDSTSALRLKEVPKRLLVVGGGIVGLEMATVYDALGSRVTVVELTGGLLAGCDPDVVRPLQRRIEKRYEAVLLNTRVAAVKEVSGGLEVQLAGEHPAKAERFDAVLVATGRRPNGDLLDAERAGVQIDERGYIPVDNRQRTNVAHVYAIGDVAGPPLLAHKATHEGKVAAEVIAGLKSGFDARVIPSVAYTDPEIAWVGLTEIEAKRRQIDVRKGVFPWAANGRSLTLGRDEGLTQLLFDPQTDRLLGMAAVGPNAGDLASEAALAIEMGSDAEDIGLTVHPHPTLSETVAMAAEVYSGTVTDLYVPRR